jgi:hypothetical protein
MAAVVVAAEPDLRGIMQGLRTNVVEIADGLLMDDFAMVSNGAKGIANHPRIPPDQVQRVAAELGPEMAAFKQFDMSVHDLSLEIATAAELEDRERAISAFQNMLSGCFGCHTAYKDRVSATLANVR